MTKLSVTRDGRFVEVFEFPDDQERIVVGRNEECDVSVSSESVSRQHCELVLMEGYHRLSDLGSSHGTFVNGRRVTECSLSQGDVVTVGEFNLAYSSQLDAATAREAAAPVAGLPTVEMPVEATAGGRAVAQVRGHLSVTEGGKPKTVILQTSTFIIGSVENAQLSISGWFAPRVAALILRDRSCFRVWDTSPRANALLVNGRQVREAELSDGDDIVVWGRRVRFAKGLPRLSDSGEIDRSTNYLRPEKSQP